MKNPPLLRYWLDKHYDHFYKERRPASIPGLPVASASTSDAFIPRLSPRGILSENGWQKYKQPLHQHPKERAPPSVAGNAN